MHKALFTKIKKDEDPSDNLIVSVLPQALVTNLEKIADTCDAAKVEVGKLFDQIQKILSLRKNSDASADLMFSRAKEIHQTVTNLENICKILPTTIDELKTLRDELNKLLIPQYTTRPGLTASTNSKVEVATNAEDAKA
jgi:hypothetical protein